MPIGKAIPPAETKIPLNIQVPKEFKFGEPYRTEHFFNAKALVDSKAGRIFVVSPVGFLEFQFAPLSSSEGNGS